METFENIRSLIVDRLERGLPKDLHYHNIEHMLDVIKQSERIASNENLKEEDRFLLKIAGLYHDIGFLFTYMGHEVVGCELVKKELPSAGFNNAQIEVICGLIMATRLPQTPLTRMEKIICDADLDYLGREDFFSISKALFLELKERKFLSNSEEWNQRQITFLRQHRYFTDSNQQLREDAKMNHLAIIEAMV